MLIVPLRGRVGLGFALQRYEEADLFREAHDVLPVRQRVMFSSLQVADFERIARALQKPVYCLLWNWEMAC